MKVADLGLEKSNHGKTLEICSISNRVKFQTAIESLYNSSSQGESNKIIRAKEIGVVLMGPIGSSDQFELMRHSS